MFRYDSLTKSWKDIPTKPISIRLPISVIETLKKEAAHDQWDKSYQALAVRILRSWCEEIPGPKKYNPKPEKKQKKTRR